MKTHSFRLGKYKIEFGRFDAMTEVPSKSNDLYMLLPPEKDFNAFDCVLHEALHADGVPDKYIHKKDGTSDTSRISRFCWRWLKKNKPKF